MMTQYFKRIFSKVFSVVLIYAFLIDEEIINFFLSRVGKELEYGDIINTASRWDIIRILNYFLLVWAHY